MLIKHTPDTFEKLHILGGMASDDILSRPVPGNRPPEPGIHKIEWLLDIMALKPLPTLPRMRIMVRERAYRHDIRCRGADWMS